MSFKIINFIITACLLSSCGVKGPPVAPPNSSIPSYVDKFMVTNSNSEEKIKIHKKNGTDEKKEKLEGK